MGYLSSPGRRYSRELRQSMRRRASRNNVSGGNKAEPPAASPANDKRPSRLGWLKNGNRPGRFADARRCGARTKRTGQPCRAPACRGKRRCRLHGGKSTGPRTVEGIQRSRRARWKHGYYSEAHREAQARALQRARQQTAEAMAYLRALRER